MIIEQQRRRDNDFLMRQKLNNDRLAQLERYYQQEYEAKINQYKQRQFYKSYLDEQMKAKGYLTPQITNKYHNGTDISYMGRDGQFVNVNPCMMGI